MKQVVNFRLSEQGVSILTMLESKLHCSKTAVVEKALQMYAKKELANQSRILKYAGVMKPHEADNMLNIIANNKDSKDIQVTL